MRLKCHCCGKKTRWRKQAANRGVMDDKAVFVCPLCDLIAPPSPRPSKSDTSA